MPPLRPPPLHWLQGLHSHSSAQLLLLPPLPSCQQQLQLALALCYTHPYLAPSLILQRLLPAAAPTATASTAPRQPRRHRHLPPLLSLPLAFPSSLPLVCLQLSHPQRLPFLLLLLLLAYRLRDTLRCRLVAAAQQMLVLVFTPAANSRAFATNYTQTNPFSLRRLHQVNGRFMRW